MLLTVMPQVFYGPATAALLAPGGADVAITPRRRIRASVSAVGVGVRHTLRPYRGRLASVAMSGAGSIKITAHRRLRAAVRVAVNTLSASDVTGAVLESPVEGTLTLRQALRLLLSVAAGNATGLESGPLAFKSLDGSKTRVGGTITSGSRSVTTRDAT